MAGSLATFLATTASVLVVGAAHAQEDLPRWRPEWTPFELPHLVLSAGSGAAALALKLALPTPSYAWKDGLLFDDALREAWRADDPATREALSSASDVLEVSFLLYPLVIDAGLFALGIHHDLELAAELALITLEAFAVSSVFIAGSKGIVGRVRPDGVPCDPAGEDFSCRSPATSESFISGHSALAFTSAGVICAHHANVPLYGGGWPDVIACVSAIGVAGVTGGLRVGADRHYATDVLAGALVGFSVGFLVPTLLHYTWWEEALSIGPSPEGRGLALSGRF